MRRMARKVVTKRGKPFQSALLPFEDEIRELHLHGMSLRKLVAEMKMRHGLEISHNAIASFLRTHQRARSFLEGIPASRKIELLKALKALWTHDSTAIEGNTLTLGDTKIVLEYGLTVKGKPLKDQQDVAAHGRAIDFVQELVERLCLAKEDLFNLHRLTVSAETLDIYRPIGAWKREENGTYGVEGGRQLYMPYASVEETEKLMMAWLDDFNALRGMVRTAEDALAAYVRTHTSFVRIHPFFDGNGRLARLLANLPVLFAGYPPIVIPSESRADYISALWTYQRKVGVISVRQPELLPQPDLLADFTELVRTAWQTTLDLVAEARQKNGKEKL